tara:strand:+ start:1410 stop:1538 length:129 start_codon:yes stop_codon:yes gene_type:complete
MIVIKIKNLSGQRHGQGFLRVKQSGGMRVVIFGFSKINGGVK